MDDLMTTYLQAVDWTSDTRWSGTKDGYKSRSRALGCVPHDQHHLHLDEVLNKTYAYGLLQVLKSKGFSPGTVNRYLSAYLSVWGSAYQAGATQTAPPTGLLQREPRGRVRVITETELGGLVAELPPAYQGLAVFLYETGCRVGEALRLPSADFDRAARTVRFTETKNGDDRSVPLSARGYQVLSRAQQDRTGFQPGPFQHLSQSAFNHHWATARERMGLQGDTEMVPHALRHSYASRLVAAGVPLAVVGKLLGHRSIKTTLRYTHLTSGDCLAALNRAGIL